ncbi:MAG: hypothetical protein HY902_14770 [Deltaproteobacteria bacterium]|nr:hypothetical protein [Deltaproteobacteria bacterium]
MQVADTQAVAPAATALWLSVEDLPAAMTGTGAPTLVWAVAQGDFELDVLAAADPAQPQTPTVEYAAAADPAAPWQPLPAPAAVHAVTGDGQHVWRLQPSLAAAKVRLRARSSAATSPELTLQVVARTPALDPFDQVDFWRVHWGRDLGQVQVKLAGSAAQVTQTKKPNGTPDWIEALQHLGLQGGDPQWNAGLRTVLQNTVRQQLWGYFHLDPLSGGLTAGSVRVQLAFDDEPWPTAGAVKVSKIAVGGDAPVIGGVQSLFGQALTDANNQQADDDTAHDLGIFTTSLLRAILQQPVAQKLLAPVVPALGGQPFGNLASDAALLDPKLDPSAIAEPVAHQRAVLFKLVLRLLATGLSSLLAHEMGHSLGLVQPGLPPHGLLAGVDGPWLAGPSDGWHIDTPGPNLMQQGKSLNITEILSQTPAFSAMEFGYLRRRLLVLP